MSDRDRIKAMANQNVVHAEGECDHEACALARAARLVLDELQRIDAVAI